MKFNKKDFKGFTSNLLRRISRHDITTYSAALSFYLLQASIPLMMVLVTVISYFLSGKEEVIFKFVDFLPNTTSDLVARALDIILTSSQSPTVTTITILFALWSATSGINRLINAINHAYGLKHNKQAIKQRLMSIVFTLVFIFLIVFLLVFQIYGSTIVGIFNAQIIEKITMHFNTNIQAALDMISSPIFKILSYIVPFLIMALAVGLFYKYSPSNSKNRIRNREAYLGGLFVSIAISMATFIYSYFVNNFSNQSVVYGALAGILALFIWLLIVSIILILGAECIAAYRESYKKDFFDTRIEESDNNELKEKVIQILKEKTNEK